MQQTYSFLLSLCFLFFLGCSSSKNQFEKGNYEKAVELAIKKLRKNPASKKQLATLKAAYDYAVKVSEQKVIQYKTSQDRFKWDKIIAQYRRMQNLYLELLKCPGCLTVVNPVDYQQPLNNALVQGATIYVQEGKKTLSAQTKVSGREAYRQFSKAKSYQENFNGIDRLLTEARIAGTEVIGVSTIPVRSKGLEISSAFFLQQLVQRLNELNYFFAEFRAMDNLMEQKLVPNHVVDLSFDDYFIGQTYVKETRETVVRDSVKVGKITDSLGTKLNVYGKVEADVQRFEKTIESGGLLNFAIVDTDTETILYQEKIPSTYQWVNDWATYQGDKRALTKDELRLAKEKELIPPPPQELFYAFTRPLFDQVAGRLQDRYRYLRK
mgnify:FL=1